MQLRSNSINIALVHIENDRKKLLKMRLKPSEIFYSQDSISKKFNNGKTIYSTLDECRDNSFKVALIPNIRVCQKNERWYTLDNRRLWVFKRLEEERRITDIEVDTVSSSLLTAKKFSTKNGGVSVKIRSFSARLHDMLQFELDDMVSNSFDDEDGDLYGW